MDLLIIPSLQVTYYVTFPYTGLIRHLGSVNCLLMPWNGVGQFTDKMNGRVMSASGKHCLSREAHLHLIKLITTA